MKLLKVDRGLILTYDATDDLEFAGLKIAVRPHGIGCWLIPRHGGFYHVNGIATVGDFWARFSSTLCGGRSQCSPE